MPYIPVSAVVAGRSWQAFAGGSQGAFTNPPLPFQICRVNSFFNLWQLVLTRVELLKDSRSKQDVLEHW